MSDAEHPGPPIFVDFSRFAQRTGGPHFSVRASRLLLGRWEVLGAREPLEPELEVFRNVLDENQTAQNELRIQATKTGP